MFHSLIASLLATILAGPAYPHGAILRERPGELRCKDDMPEDRR